MSPLNRHLGNLYTICSRLLFSGGNTRFPSNLNSSSCAKFTSTICRGLWSMRSRRVSWAMSLGAAAPSQHSQSRCGSRLLTLYLFMWEMKRTHHSFCAAMQKAACLCLTLNIQCVWFLGGGWFGKQIVHPYTSLLPSESCPKHPKVQIVWCSLVPRPERDWVDICSMLYTAG